MGVESEMHMRAECCPSGGVWSDGGCHRSAELHGSKVLVVGTTSDYVDLLRRSHPGRVLYLSDLSERSTAIEPSPPHGEEILCDLDDDVSLITARLRDHLRRWNCSLDGLVCFDCESMELAASLAAAMSLPYPSVESIALCRDKFASKSLWQRKGVSCPRHRLVRSADAVFDFLKEIDRPCVIKPLGGSGSELVFVCSSSRDCDKAAQLILSGLAQRKGSRLYNRGSSLFIAEEFIDGPEFSCDFAISKGRTEIVRLTKKIKYSPKPFGTINGYMTLDWSESGLNRNRLTDMLQAAAAALGIVNAVCMVDFVVDQGRIVLLEISPRPGGDCIPHLLRSSTGFDTLSYTLDFAQNRTAPPAGRPVSTGSMAALRLFAETNGDIVGIDGGRIQRDSRTRDVHLVRSPGHRIVLPPSDYDSWYLGYVLFQPSPGVRVEEQCAELRKLLDVEIQRNDC